MKNYIYTLIAAVLMTVCSTSCSITQKFTITGQPGTEILDYKMDRVGVIDNSGKAKITLKTNGKYYAYMVAHTPGSGEYVPFALDYKTVNIAYKGLFAAPFVSLAVIGGGIALTGVAETAGIALFSLGLASTITCFPITMVFESSKSPTETYRYLEEQRTIQNFNFTKPVFNSQPKTLDGYSTLTPVAKTETVVAPEVSQGKKTIGDKSKKTLKDAAKLSEGRYSASGTLSDRSGNVVERYSGAVIIVERVDKNTVNVNVIDDDGLVFFDTPNKYSVNKAKDGKINLKHGKITGANIVIDGDKALYMHPRVVIDGETYTLKLTGEK